MSANVRVGVNQGYLDAGLAIAKAKIDAFTAKNRDLNIGVMGNAAGLAGIETALSDITSELQQQTGWLIEVSNQLHDMRDAWLEDAAAVHAYTSAVDDAGRSTGVLAAALAAISGAGGGHGGGGGGGGGPFWWLRGTIGGIAAWHVVLDGVVEGLIAVGTAAAAAAVGIAAMAPAAGNIKDYLSSIHTVNKALGNQIPGLTTKFDALAKAMAPQVIEAYGGALSLVSHSTGGLAQVAHQVVDMFDTWIAKIDLWAKNSGMMNKLLEDGVIFLGQFGSIFGHLGDALKNFLGAMPGIAHYLLDIVQGAAQLVDWFSKLPGPLLTATLAIHGAYIWGRLLGTALLNAAKGAASFAVSMAKLAVNPLVWVGAAAAALGYMAYQSTQADKATKTFVTNLENGLAGVNASQAITQTTADIGALNTRLQTTTVSSELQHWHLGFQSLGDDLRGIADAWGSVFTSKGTSFFGNLGKALGDTFIYGKAQSAGAAIAISANIKLINSAINTMLGSQRNLFAETGKLMDQGFSYTQALGLMDLAGVRWNDTAAVMAQKVTNLENGYKAMSIRGGLLANSVNAVTFATLQQDSKVSQLTQAWSSFFSTLTGGETGFVGFAQQTEGLYQAMAAGAPKVSESNGKISASITGLAGAASGAKGTLTGLNLTSLNLRSTFLQSAQAAQAQMNNLTMLASAAGLGAKGTAMLTQASKDMVASLLPAAKHSQALTTALYGLAQQGGYQGADSFKELAKWADNVKHPLKNLDNITTTLTVDAGNLKTDVENLSVALGQTLTSAISKAVFFANGGQTAFNNYATALKNTGVNSDQTRSKAVTLAQELLTLTGNTNNAHKEFDTMTIAMGGTKGQADKLWNDIKGQLDPAISGIPSKQVTITMTGKGSYSISSQGPSIGLPNPTNSPPLTHRAAGGGAIYGPGSSTSDSIPAWLSDGEYVIRADAVNKYGQGFFDAVNAGMYAGGGPVLGGNTSVLTGQYAQTMVNAFQDAMVKSMVSAMKGAISSARSASYPGGGSSGPGAAAAQAYARSILPLYGWGAGQMNSLIPLWNQESGWRWNATNPQSGAYGIPQSLPASKMAAAGADWRTNPATQIRWGLGYIKARPGYGSPAAAWAHEQQFGWYRHGGPVRRASGGSVSSNVQAGEFCSIAEHGKTRNGLVCKKGPDGRYRWEHPSGSSSGGGGSGSSGHSSGSSSSEHTAGASLMNFYLSPQTVTAIMKEQTKFLEDIAQYYTGPARRWRDRMVQSQTDHLIQVDSKLAKLNSTIQAAKSFQSGIQSGLASYAGLSGLDAFGNLMVPGVKPGQSVGQGLEGQLHLKLANLKKWQADIKAMQRAKVSPALISQVAQMGPDTGMAYAEAILAGGHSLISEMNKTESQIGAIEKSTAKAATRAVYGKSISAMWEDEHELKKAAQFFGRELAKEAAKWFRVPRNQQPPAVLHFHGQHPTAEEKHQLMRDLALVLG